MVTVVDLMRRVYVLLSSRNKAVLGALGVLVGWGYVVVGSPAAHISAQEWMGLAAGLAGVVGVERVTNGPSPE